MNKILLSIMTMGIVAALMGAGTFAYFQDSATSGSNVFDNSYLPTSSPLMTVTGTSSDHYPDGTPRGSTVSDINFDGTNTVVFNYANLLPGYYGEAQLDVLPNYESHIYIKASSGTVQQIASQIAFYIHGADYSYGADPTTIPDWDTYITTGGGKTLDDFITDHANYVHVDLLYQTSETHNYFDIEWKVNPEVTSGSQIAGSVDFTIEFAAYQLYVNP